MKLPKLTGLLALLCVMLLPGTAAAAVLGVGDSLTQNYTLPGALIPVPGYGPISESFQFTLDADVTGVEIAVNGGDPMSPVNMASLSLSQISPSASTLLASVPSPMGSVFTVAAAPGLYEVVFNGFAPEWLGEFSVQVTAVPLPAAFWMFGSALMGLFAFARRRNQRSAYA